MAIEQDEILFTEGTVLEVRSDCLQRIGQCGPAFEYYDTRDPLPQVQTVFLLPGCLVIVEGNGYRGKRPITIIQVLQSPTTTKAKDNSTTPSVEHHPTYFLPQGFSPQSVNTWFTYKDEIRELDRFELLSLDI